MTEQKNENSSQKLSFFQEVGSELLGYKHSMIRGMSTAAGMGSAYYTMDQMGALNPNVPHLDTALYGLAAVTGAIVGLTHADKEKGIGLLKKANPEKTLRNLYNTVSQGAMTAAYFAAGALGVGSVAMGKMTNETAQAFGANQQHMELAAVTATAIPAVAMLSKFVGNFMGPDSLEVQMAKNHRALKI